MYKLSCCLLVVFIQTFLCCPIDEDRYPQWPNEFRWSYRGAIKGMACTQIYEASDPHTWKDNYFCHKSGSGIQKVGMRWSYHNKIKGMKCTKIIEPSDPLRHTWTDNYFCVPQDSPFTFKWSHAGLISGMECIQWLEPSDPHTWADNYLCM